MNERGRDRKREREREGDKDNLLKLEKAFEEDVHE